MNKDTEGRRLAESHKENQQLNQDPMPGLVQSLIPVYLVASKGVYLCEEKKGGRDVKLNRHVKCFQILTLNIES